MANENTLIRGGRLTGRFISAGVVVFGLGVIALVAAVVVPISGEAASLRERSRQLKSPLSESQDVQPLLLKMAGVRLIKPSQVQAAVKDSGAAQRLAKKLKLQGVVQMPNGLVAYIKVDNEGVKSVREGGKVLDFVVDRIEPGKVTVSLQAVVVTLEH